MFPWLFIICLGGMIGLLLGKAAEDSNLPENRSFKFHRRDEPNPYR